ncbi:hypothetical protein [Thiobacillus sp.]|uniref:hypothetical protein n=1 Tax=Thiobacillus sp. TaxID=924 RepID=UPI0011D57D51|nr:hypothetical protein [Thiobacillus sp.]TXH73987.1 MAG: hypothetical protein E6Q82_12135 [Thiobacillus sp.]
MNQYARPESWTFILYRYLPRLTLCSLAWEIAQLPLYTLWAEPHPGRIVYAVAHCTVGDAVIGTTALALALILNRAGEHGTWPGVRIVLSTVLLTVAYTLLSERINLARGNWAYTAWMPVLPWIGVGLAPLLQWVVVPCVAWGWANRKH